MRGLPRLEEGGAVGTRINERFSRLGGVDLELPRRDDAVRAPAVG